MIIIHKWDWNTLKDRSQTMSCYRAQCISYHDFGKYKVGIWL